LGWKVNPPCGQHSEDVAVRKEGDVTVLSAHSADDPIGPGADLLWTLSTRAAVGEEHPTRSLLLDLLGRQAFIFTVVPFHQVAVDFSAVAEAGQRAGLSSALKRACEDERESFVR